VTTRLCAVASRRLSPRERYPAERTDAPARVARVVTPTHASPSRERPGPRPALPPPWPAAPPLLSERRGLAPGG